MDSDDSRDDVSSGSDSGSNVKGPRSPSSIHSGDADSQDYKRPSSPRGPRSPSPCGPRSPSPEGSMQSNSPINSPKRDIRSPIDDRYITPKSPSANSISSQDGDDNMRHSPKSNMEDDDGGLSPKSTSSRSSIKSRGSIKSRNSIKSMNSIKSKSSIKSRDSNRSRSRSSIKSPSPVRRTPMSPKSPDNSPARSVNSYKSTERRGPMSPPAEDGHTSDSSVSSIESRGSRRSHGSRRSRSQESKGSRSSPMSRGSPASRGSRGSRDSRDSSRNKSNDRLDAQAEEISDGEMEYEGGKDSDDEKTKTKPIESAKINLSHEDLSDVSDLDSLGGHSEEDESMQEKPTAKQPPMDLRQKIDEAKNRKLIEKQNQNPPEKTSKTEDGEEQLDFEAEDGECVEENTKAKPSDEATKETVEEEEGAIPDATPAEKEEVEEGEVTDDDEVRPEETEPRPVCRFYSRGQCTWGASCRFLHPGVTDKGNYTMFELIRPMVPGAPGYGGAPEERFERPGYGVPPIRGEPPVVESAWERGLRTAKEMMRKAIKRKEQDMDFEEKKMNLTLAQDELDKENGYYTRSASPIPVEPVPRHYVNVRHPLEYPRQGGGDGVAVEGRRQRHVTIEKNRHPTQVTAKARVPPEEYHGRRVVYEPPEPRVMRMEPEYEVPRERVRSYRELPAHRMPDYYNDRYEEPVVPQTRRPKREVIVQRIEPAGGGRGDEWADPWMRSKSPSGRGKSGRFGARRQSYSSASSYSSSSSSRSTSASSKTSYRGDSRSRSRSPTSRVRRRVAVPKSPSHRMHRIPTASSSGGPPHRAVSPSVIVSEKKAANERAALMNPPAPSPKKAHKDNRPPSPGMMRTSAQNPPAPTKGLTDQYGRTRDRSKHDADRKKLAVAAAIVASAKSRARASRSSSASDSSGSSSSDSESSYSSSTSSRDGSPTPRRKLSEKDLTLALKAKALDALKSGSDKRQIKLNLKSQTLKKSVELEKKAELLQGKKRLATSPPTSDAASAPKIAAAGKNSSSNNSKKSTSRREELLKQLKAVEDAIAKKRSKIN